MTRPNPVRTPDGYASISSGGGGVPVNIAVGFYTGYASAMDAPLSLGAKVADDVGGGTFDVVLTGFGFDDGTASTVELVPNGPPITAAATISAVAWTAPSGSTPGSIQVSIDLDGTPADSIGQYALVVTNDDGNRAIANVEIIAAA